MVRSALATIDSANIALVSYRHWIPSKMLANTNTIPIPFDGKVSIGLPRLPDVRLELAAIEIASVSYWL